METKIVQVNSIVQFVDIITALYETTERNLGREEILLFRGIKDTSYELKPYIARNPDLHIHNSLLWYEESIIHEAIRKRPEIFKEDEYPINLLTKLQHYGIPTRLLDITTNALIALFFACQKNKGKKDNEDGKKAEDGEVIVFKFDKVSIHPNTSAIANAIALSYKLGHFYDFDELVIKAEKYRFFDDLSYNLNKDKFKTRESYLEKLKQKLNKPHVVFPLELSERQRRQQGVFFIFPNSRKDEINGINKNDDTIEKRIIIEEKSKSKLSEQISFFGITKEFLFPDSIDSLGETIRENVFQLYRNSGLGT